MMPPDLRVLPVGAGRRAQDGGDRAARHRGGRRAGAAARLPLRPQRGGPAPLFYPARALLNFFRSVDTLVYALVFVAAVGLGPFPGVLAVIAYTTTSLAKLYSEAIEGIEPGPVDAITATGATRLQVLRFGVLPQVLPLFLSYVLYRLETNIRAATVLGFVGAGGIGFYLQTYLRMIDYPRGLHRAAGHGGHGHARRRRQLPPPREAHLAASTSNRRLHRDGREGDRGGLWDSFPPRRDCPRRVDGAAATPGPTPSPASKLT